MSSATAASWGRTKRRRSALCPSHRKIIDGLIEQHHGRFVNSAGDSVLAEFASVVNAVQCAVEIQTTLKAENANLPPERRMEFRIGVNLGDVMVDGEQIYGDGVNVAARLESLADPGGICISGTVHEQITEQAGAGLRGPRRADGQEHRRAGAGVPGAAGAASRHARGEEPGGARAKIYGGEAYSRSLGWRSSPRTIVLVQHLSLRPPTHLAHPIPPAQTPALPLPDKPSIAVLPFTNMSGDPRAGIFQRRHHR